MGMPNRNCCAKCMRRTDQGFKGKNKRFRIDKIKDPKDSLWFFNWFKSIGVNTKIYHFLCNACYRLLIKLKIDKTGKMFMHHNDNTGLAACLKKKSGFISNYSNNLIEERFKNLLGISSEDFSVIYSFIKDCNWHMKNVSLKDGLFFYLAKLRLGLSIQKLIALIPICSSIQAYRLVEKIRQMLVDKFVNKYLGLNHITRGNININHTTNLSKELFDLNEGNMILVWDGTYVYIEKSADYTFAKGSYSTHKNLHLLKMMMCTFDNESIIEKFQRFTSVS
jgi:hypothetical protein